MYYFQEYTKKEKPAYMPVVRFTESFNTCPEYFTDELKAALEVLSDGDFISDKEVRILDAFVLNPLLDRLRGYCRMDPDGGLKAALEMVDMLEKIRSDNEMFPVNQTSNILVAAGKCLELD